MNITKNEDGTFDLKGVREDTVRQMYFAVYQERDAMSRDFREERIGDVDAEPEDLQFLDEMIPRVEAACEEIHEAVLTSVHASRAILGSMDALKDVDG